MRSPRSKLCREIFAARIGQTVPQRRLGARFGRTASWVSRQGDIVTGHIYSPSGGNWTGEVWERVSASGRDGYRRIA